jgi:5-methylcytosine-specific restriction protein B
VREAEFRAWLEARRWNGKPLSETAIYGRIRRLHRVERSLGDLGFEQADLDLLFDADQVSVLRDKLRALIDGAPSGERPPATLVPQAANPSGQLRNLLAAVRQYAQFASGADPNAHDVEAGGVTTDREPVDWIVTARFGEEDGVARFLETGSWSLPAPGRYSEKLRTVQPGDRIAMRDYFHQKHDLPFRTNGARVSVMRFRAVGVVTANADDGLSISVDWSPIEPPRLWFFYTNQEALWRLPDSETAARLAAFVFEGEEQIYDWWLARPYWRDRLLGDATDADRIRRHVLDEYIEPARASGAATVEVHVLTINNEMELDKAWPNICQALEGAKMQELSGLPAPRRIGAPMSTATRFVFSLVEGGALMKMPDPTNLILYGPPGTGKTYTTAEHAVRLCGEKVPEDRTELMVAYKRLSEAGRIEFVTFHQSMAYEEFVEGLRPSSVDEDGQPLAAGFRLAPTPGIFRKIARRAELSTGANGETFTVGDRQVFKMSIGDATKPEWAWLFDEAIAEGYAYLGFGNIDWSDKRFADRAAILEAVKAHTGPRGSFVEGTAPSLQAGPVKSPDLFRNEVKIGDVIVVAKGLSLFRAIGVVEGDYEYVPRDSGDYSHRRKVRWLWHDADGVPVSEINTKRLSIDTIYRLGRDNLNIPALERYANSQREEGGGAPEPFVLVIDEINRANISKVFGELITLLEADKRIGADNELRVRLPYSGDSFGVPANLHIVGTMNTADRSIALLDTALRRRFTFEELMPKPSVLASVDGIDLPRLLRTLNDRIEYLFDREHQIGHAYFMHCRSRNDVGEVMRHKVIPLLAEYFYEDWSRVAAVLGDLFPDDGKEHHGDFLDRRPLKSPFADSEGATRYRWMVRDPANFAYAKLTAAA